MDLTLAAPSKKDALVLGKRHLSYDELLARAFHLAKKLKTSRGQHVLLFAENSLEWAVAAYATWAAGKVLVPLDAESPAADFRYVLGDSESEWVFCSNKTLPIVDEALGTPSTGKNGKNTDKSKTKGVPGPEVFLIDDLLKSEIEIGTPQAIVGQTGPDQSLAAIIYTSGTTGDPKGVMLTFANLFANLTAVRKFGYFAPDERVLLFLPLHHVLPLMGCLLAPLATGGTTYLCPSLAREDVLRVLCEGKITMLVAVPRFYELLSRAISERIKSSFALGLLFSLAERQQSEALSMRLFAKVHAGFGGHVRYMISGGAPLNPEIVRLFGTLGFRLCEGYGMTECAPLISFPDPKNLKAGYCGKPIPGSKVEIRDGEIVVRGPQVMKGYFRRPEETAEILRDGWLHTGDLGEFDENGFLRITGRKKEILVLPSGKNVNPALSEALLEEHEEVEEAGIFLDGDVLHALIFPRPSSVPKDEKDIESFIFSRAVRDHNRKVAPHRKISRVTILDQPLPRTRLNKLKRHKFAELDRNKPTRDPARGPQSPREEALLDYFRRIGCSQVSVTSRLGADLGLDSMARLELREFLRATFSVVVDEFELNDRLRVEELSELLEQRADKLKGTKPEIEASEVDWQKILDEKTSVQLPSTSVLHVAILILLRIFTFFFVHLRVKGSRALPPGPKIFAPNHQSALDGVFLTSALRLWDARDVYFLAKQKHMKHPVVRFLADRGRVIVLDESAGVQASLRAVSLALKAGRSVVVFPEGTRSKSGALGDFKKSYAMVAHHAKAAIVPVALQGTGDVLPPGRLTPRFGKFVRVTFLPSIEATEDASETNELVRAAILEKLS